MPTSHSLADSPAEDALSLELYEQANARLWRQGQKETVVIHHLVVKGTMDEQVMRALHDKAADQNALLAAVKARIQEVT